MEESTKKKKKNQDENKEEALLNAASIPRLLKVSLGEVISPNPDATGSSIVRSR